MYVSSEFIAKNAIFGFELFYYVGTGLPSCSKLKQKYESAFECLSEPDTHAFQIVWIISAISRLLGNSIALIHLKMQ